MRRRKGRKEKIKIRANARNCNEIKGSEESKVKANVVRREGKEGKDSEYV